MSSLFVIVVIAVFIGVMIQSRRTKRLKAAEQRAELEQQVAVSRKAADEDVTRFGEELQRLDSDVVGHPLDEAMTQDYQRALDAYENAKSALAAVTRPEEIKGVTEILEDGRYAIACVKARVAGEPLPQKRPPCFFNPAHGPSTQNVSWAPAGGVAREVPACAADAERVLAGADPNIRTVQVGARRVPYWEGGPAYQPWMQGYYSRWNGSDLLSGMMIGSLLFNGGGLFSGLGQGLGGIGDGIGDMVSGIGDGLGDIGDGIGHGIEDIGDGIGDFFDGLF